MTSDPALLTKRIKHLSLALIVSGVINIGVLSLLLYWVLRERPPTPYCELRPATSKQQQMPLADLRGCAEALAQLSNLSFSDLTARLSNNKVIENGYAERDLALGCLVALHHFDLQRALPKNAQPWQNRIIEWNSKERNKTLSIVVYPGLSEQQFDSILQFSKTERWPLTSEGLFLLLKSQKEANSKEINPVDSHLIETFALTSEFWTVELLFNRLGPRVNKQEILALLLEGNWSLLKSFVSHQRQAHDSSDARRQKFLLDYFKEGSPTAALLLLKTEWDFALKKLDDQQVIALLQIVPSQSQEGEQFAIEMLASPRSIHVWRQASQWLYAKKGEPMPKEWTHAEAIVRFIPEKAHFGLLTKQPAVVQGDSIGVSLVKKPVTVPASSTPPLLPPPLKPAILAKPVAIKTGKLSETLAIKPVSLNAKSEKSMKSAKSAKNAKGVSENKNGATEKKNVAADTKKDVSKIANKNVAMSRAPKIYVVQEGDSLWKIARKFRVQVDEIKKINQLKSDMLKPGLSLKIPVNS